MRADTIVGYTYRADTYCPGAMAIDRADERSFDSSEFPKVVFADMVGDSSDGVDWCGRCDRALLD